MRAAVVICGRTYFLSDDLLERHGSATLTARKGGQSVDLKYHQDFIAVSGVHEPHRPTSQ